MRTAVTVGTGGKEEGGPAEHHTPRAPGSLAASQALPISKTLAGHWLDLGGAKPPSVGGASRRDREWLAKGGQAALTHLPASSKHS